MTTCDEIEADKRGEQPSLIRLVLFFVMQGVAVILVGFAALFLSFEPVWSAERVQAAFVKPGDARSGSLLLKTDDGYADASRLGIDVDLTVSGPTVRARVTQIFRNPTQGLGRGRLRLSAAVGRRGRYAEDGDRRPRRGRRHQGAAAGQDHLRTGQAERTEGGADRTGAAEHLHQLGRQYRPRRNRAGADRISGAGPAIRQRVLAAGADGGRPALQSRTRRAERRLPARRRRLGRGQIRSRAGSRPHLARSARPRDQRAGQSDPHHRAAAGRLPARRGQEPSSRDQDGKGRCRHEHHSPGRRPGAGRPRFRADLEAGRGESAVGRTVPRARRRQRLPARLRHAAFGRAGPAETAAARGHLRDRQFRLDGRRLDHPGQGEPHLRARPPAAERPLQRDPLRSHHGCAVPGGRAGRQGAYRPGHLLCRRAAGQWRHRNGAGDARRAVRQRRRCRTTSGRSCS